MWIKQIIKNKAFSLIEVITALAMVSVVMLSIFSLTTQNIQVQVINRNNMIASMLAQEGLEMVRNVRDQNWLLLGNGVSNWYEDIYNPAVANDNSFTVDLDLSDNTIKINNSINNIDNAKLKFHNTQFIYNHTLGLNSNFNRIIKTSGFLSDGTPCGASDEPDYLEVGSYVRWQDKGRDYNYIASTTLYDWR